MIVTMPQGCKPSKALYNNPRAPRTPIEQAWIKLVEGGYELQVTNSYIAARIPLGDADMSEGPISKPILTAWERDKIRHADIDAETVTVSGASYARIDEGQFPNFDDIWPEPYPRTFTLGLNVKYLADLAAALGCTELQLTFNADNSARPVLASTLNGNDARGLLMPLRVDGGGLQHEETS